MSIIVEDVENGIKEGVGFFVADSLEEIKAIDGTAGKYGKKQKILLNPHIMLLQIMFILLKDLLFSYSSRTFHIV